MQVLCGTDFSDRAEEAARLAALLAQRTGGELTLVHVLDTRSVLLGPAPALDAIEENARQRLQATADALRQTGVKVNTELPAGWPDEAIVAEAKKRGAGLLVMPAIGRRDGVAVRLGKTCERVLRTTETPMLVLREASPLLAWLRGERALRVLVAYDFTPQADAALLFAARLAELGSCQLLAAYVDDPRREATRLGLLDDPTLARQHVREEIVARIGRALPSVPFEVVVSAHQGEPAARLAQLAESEQADLLLVGSHQRNAVERLFTGSVALDLLRDSPANVLVVPGAAVASVSLLPPVIRRIVAATDLSPIGNRAVAHALALAPSGAEVVVVHVISPNLMRNGRYGRPVHPAFASEHAAVVAERRQALEALVADPGNAKVRIDLIESDRPDRALLEAIEREAADLVCAGTIGRTGLGAMLLGSTAQTLLRGTRRPILLVQPQER